MESRHPQKYDYIIAGAGLAGLSLAYKLNLDPQFRNKRILLIDKDQKDKNDRTWCYWSKNSDGFDQILYHKWEHLSFKSDNVARDFKTEPYLYKMIRGIDFYKFTLDQLKANPSIEFLQAEITSTEERSDNIKIHTTKGTYTAEYIFKSYTKSTIDQTKDHFVWQHFKGIIIETSENKFDAKQATFMDFRVVQDNETRFFYVLPTSPTRALIELAVFSNDIPTATFYDPYIKDYIRNNLGISDYEIIEEEIGAIPMTTRDWPDTIPSRLVSIGTNSGSVKPSSGYAFSRIQQHIDLLIMAMKNNELMTFQIPKTRYHLYDRIMLNAILTEKTSGQKVFESLFKKLSLPTIFKFLDEEKDFVNDLKIFSAPPKLPFIKPHFEEVLK